MRTVAILAPVLVLLAPARTSACDCPATPAVQPAVAASAAVFEGRVVSIERGAQLEGAGGAVPPVELRATVAVVQTWKGADREQVIAVTGADRCGIAFEVDTTWLIYASAERDGEVTVSRCSRTRRIEEASEDLGALGAAVVPVDIGERDEVEAPRSRPPARGGCASCAVRAAGGGRGLAALLALAALAWTRRR